MVDLCFRCFSGMLVQESPVLYCVLLKDSLLSSRLVLSTEGLLRAITLVAEIVLFAFGASALFHVIVGINHRCCLFLANIGCQ
jgi:hypothetical protein